MGCTSLTEITIPRGETEDMGLFTDCTKLATVNIGKDVSSISSGTFIHCPALTKINVDPENTAYASDENGILFNKDKTTILAYPAGRIASSYVFPQSVNAIEDYAFHKCVHLTSITISSGVTSLPYEAFDYCTALASVEIPETVTTIEYWAFGDCTSLQSLTIPASVKSIGGAAFYDSGLTTLWVECKTPPTITDSTFDHCASLEAIIVPSAAVQDYQHAANWSAYEGKIKPYYDITYDLDGGTNSAANPDRYWSGSDNVTLTDPTREGYSFAGWTWDGQDEPVKTVTIPGAFTGDVAFTAYWIKPLTSQDISITIPEQTYTGSTLAPKVTVKDGSKELIAGTDYTVSYQQGGKAVTEMKDAVDYDVVITGIGHYDGSVTKTFTISPKSITGAVVTLDKTQMTYNGEEQSVKVTGVVIDGLSLTSKDYTVSGNTGKKKDTYTVTVTGQGNYKDTATATWQIVEKAMTVSAENVTVPYDGQPHGITVIVTDPAEGAAVKYGTAEGIYDLEASPTISDAGTLTVYFKATAENYNDYTGFATVTVTAPPVPQKTDIGKAKISAEDQEYTGKEIKPKLTVKLNGKKLKEKKDYTAAFKFNKDIGKATVTITGTGDYTGTATGSFLIIPKKVGSPKLTAEKGKKDALTLSWKAGKGIDGYEIEYGLKKDFKGAKKIKVKGAKNDEYEIKKLTAKKTYYVRIRAWKKAKGKMYYSAWSKTLSKKVK